MSGDGASRSDLPRLYHTAAEGLAMSSGGDSSIQLFEPRPQHTTATGTYTLNTNHPTRMCVSHCTFMAVISNLKQRF